MEGFQLTLGKEWFGAYTMSFRASVFPGAARQGKRASEKSLRRDSSAFRATQKLELVGQLTGQA
jgi:hypothetical protein